MTVIHPPYRIALPTDLRWDWLCVTHGDFVMRFFQKADLTPDYWNSGITWQSVSMPVTATNTPWETIYTVHPHACNIAKQLPPPSNQNTASRLRAHVHECSQCTRALNTVIHIVRQTFQQIDKQRVEHA